MKKTIFTIAMCVSLLFTVSSCSHDDSVSDNSTPPQAESSVNAKFTAQNRTYSATFSKDYVFNSISLNGNSTLTISVSNVGTAAANMNVYGNNGIYSIGTALVPKGGAYYTYNFPVTGMSGNVVVRIGSSVGGGTVSGNLQLSSF